MRVYPHYQRGAAILLAMLIMVTVASLATVAIVQHWRSQEAITLANNQMQQQWLTRATLGWAHMILRQDKIDNKADTLKELWAMPLPMMSVASFFNQDTDIPFDASISGRIEDLTAKWNWTNLVLVQGDIQGQTRILSPIQVNVAKRIAAKVGIPLTRFQTILDNYAQKNNTRITVLNPLACLQHAGFTLSEIQQLWPLVTCLPSETSININTASQDLLTVLTTDAKAKQLIELRDQDPFLTMNNFFSDNPSLISTFPTFSYNRGLTGYDTRSLYFAIHITTTYAGVKQEHTEYASRMTYNAEPWAYTTSTTLPESLH